MTIFNTLMKLIDEDKISRECFSNDKKGRSKIIFSLRFN